MYPTVLRLERTWDGRPVPVGEHLRLSLIRSGAGLAIEIDAPFFGRPAAPSLEDPPRNLWRYETVFLFLIQREGSDDLPRYVEAQMTPHGLARFFRFRGRRRAVEYGLPLACATRIRGDRWEGHAWIPGTQLPPPPYRANAFSLQGEEADRRCLAFYPIPGRVPDFHRITMYPPIDL